MAETGKLALTEEQVHVEKRLVTTGKVRVHTTVDVSDELVTQDLTADEVWVSRVPIDRYVDAVPQVRTEGNLTIVPVLEEVLVVQTKLLLKEEIHIQRSVTRESVTETVPIRKQRVVVESTKEAE
jgi:stress response protein YsnF